MNIEELSNENEESKLTSPIQEFLKTAKKIDDNESRQDEQKFNNAMIIVENEIRRQESQTLAKMQNMRIEGIVI